MKNGVISTIKKRSMDRLDSSSVTGKITKLNESPKKF